MDLHWIDWLVIGGYFCFTVAVGLYMRKRASSSVDEYFLSGRSLPWWIAGTSMIATSFASDTPLLVSGWVRTFGIWKNWAWWCYALTGIVGVFLFARWWRRSGVMTKAELAELRYGSENAKFLRGFLGVMHALVMNTMVLNWVIVAAKKIIGVVFDIPDDWAVAIACTIAMTYSLLAGFWGVVITDLLQFAISIIGAVVLATICWNAVGGTEALDTVVGAGKAFPEQTTAFFPATEAAGLFDAAFWTVPIAAIAVYLGVGWWAVESADGSTTAIQRIAATRDERQGMLAFLWYNVVHYAFRPWPWIVVGLMSLVVLPDIQVESPATGTISAVSEDGRRLTITTENEPREIDLATPDDTDDWRAKLSVDVGDEVETGAVIASTDPERAYVVMMTRYLPVGLLGLVVASLLAAFMSTIDTHVNLASSFFVNDVYRRFLRPGGTDRHYVLIARVASIAVLLIGGSLAYLSSYIGGLFEFFLAFLSGVGPVYVLRWLWWRIRATTEIVALVTSGLVATAVSWCGPFFAWLQTKDIDLWSGQWSLGPLSEDGALQPSGRILIVVGTTLATCLISLLFTRSSTDPADVVGFYRKVRPIGWWGPVRALAPEVEPDAKFAVDLVGMVGGLSLIFGLLIGVGCWILDRSGAATGMLVAAVGGVMTAWSVHRIVGRSTERSETSTP